MLDHFPWWKWENWWLSKISQSGVNWFWVRGWRIMEEYVGVKWVCCSSTWCVSEGVSPAEEIADSKALGQECIGKFWEKTKEAMEVWTRWAIGWWLLWAKRGWGARLCWVMFKPIGFGKDIRMCPRWKEELEKRDGQSPFRFKVATRLPCRGAG